MQLSDLKDHYSGRVFILGTGPSLAQVESWENVTPTFGCNKLGFWGNAPTTTFYACNYDKVLKGEAPDPKPEQHRFLVGLKDNIAEARYLEWPEWVWVTKQKSAQLDTGQAVSAAFGAMTLVCAQIAYVLGFREMYLLGCDQTNQGSIFDPEDDRLSDQPEGVSFADARPWWRDFRQMLERNGGAIYDCTPNGNLNGVLRFKPLMEVV